MGRLICLLILSFTGIFCNAQDTVFSSKTITTSQGNITDFSIDNMGNAYLVINHTRLKKVDTNGDSLAVFDDVKRFGKITSVDAGMPFKLLVFYKEIGTIVVLDRFLAIKNIIELRKNNIQQASAIKLSYDNNIWVYDEFDSRIKKIDDNGKLLSQSADLRNVFEQAPAIEVLFDDNRVVYLYDRNQGWFLFDYYGAFIKKSPFRNWISANVDNGIMIGVAGNTYVSAKKGDIDFKTSILPIPLEGVLKVRSRKIRIGHSGPARILYYVLYNDRFTIYDAQ